MSTIRSEIDNSSLLMVLQNSPKPQLSILKGRPCGHAWLVCLSKCVHDDHEQEYCSGKDLVDDVSNCPNSLASQPSCDDSPLYRYQMSLTSLLVLLLVIIFSSMLVTTAAEF